MKPQCSWILTYHSLDTSGSVISLDPTIFRQHMTALHELGTKVVPLEQIRENPGAVAITFDDGFRNFCEHALPALKEFGFPATVFVVTSFCGGRNDWPSQPVKPSVPVLPLMTWSELREITASGISLGSHSATHPRMASLSEEQLEEELRISRAQLEDRTGERVATFAYPYGESTLRVQEAVRRNYRVACGTKLAHVSSDSDVSDLPRLDTYYFRDHAWFRRIGNQYGEAYISTRRWLRELRSGWSKL